MGFSMTGERDSDSGLTFRETVISQLSSLNTQMRHVATRDDISSLRSELEDYSRKAAASEAASHVASQQKICAATLKRKDSVPPPAISSKGWDTIKQIAILMAAALLGGGGVTGIQHFLK
jgi:hypothetical protein